MGTESYRVSDDLFLVRHPISTRSRAAKPVEIPTNHVAVIDCSGSMSYDLPKIREQLKRRLPKLLGEQDTISIVWFSGAGQFGALIEAEPVSTLADLQAVEKAIDRWLRPVGLTGFKDPIEEVGRLVERVAKKRWGSVFSLFFMSDGCDNQWPRQAILKAVDDACGELAAATFVEYGYYADRPLLAAMAERAGGALIFAEDFDRYTPAFEAAVQKRPTGAKRKSTTIKGDPIGGFVFAMQDGELTTYALSGDKAAVPEDLDEVWYLSPSKAEKTAKAGGRSVDALYAAMSLYSVRMMPDVVYPLLRATGDVAFIEQFSTCFGKQKYSEFMDAAKAAAFDAARRLTKGYDPNRVPRDDAFTVLDVLELLSKDPEARVLLDHPAFKYNRIGRVRVDSNEVLTAEEQDRVSELTAKMQAERDPKKVAALAAEVAAITDKPAALKFEPDPAPEGYTLDKLTFNEERPNVSFLVRKPGRVDLSPRLAEKGDRLGKIPASFGTFVYRNYAVVKDGLVNVDNLPIKASHETLAKLDAEGCTRISKADQSADRVVDLRKLPVINRAMVESTSAKALFEKELELTKARAAQKVYNSLLKELEPEGRKSEAYAALYGAEAATWLKEQGITDYSGFSPKSVQADARDYYVGKELKVSIKGLSSLPSLKDVRERIESGKLTPAAALMAPVLTSAEAVRKASASAPDPDAMFRGWLAERVRDTTATCRALMFELARIKFAVVVGQTWFKEFASLDENTLSFKADGQTYEGKVEMREVQITI